MFFPDFMTNCILFVLFGPIQLWILPPGDFVRNFAITHNRASVTIYLPTSNFTLKSVVRNQISITTLSDFSDESKIFKVKIVSPGFLVSTLLPKEPFTNYMDKRTYINGQENADIHGQKLIIF